MGNKLALSQLADSFFGAGSANATEVLATLEEYVGAQQYLATLEANLQAFISNPAHELPTVDSSRIIVEMTQRWMLFLSVQNPPSKHIYSQPFRGFICPVNRAIRVKRLMLPDGWHAERFDDTVRIEHSEEIVLQPKCAHYFDGAKELIELMPDDESTVVLKLFEAPTATVEWAFDRSDRSVIGVVAADPVASRRKYILKALGDIGSPTSAPYVESACDDATHFIRWAAVQALGKIDGQATLRVLEGMAMRDPHPEIRSGASAILKANRN